jgi:hypothetical protein
MRGKTIVIQLCPRRKSTMQKHNSHLTTLLFFVFLLMLTSCRNGQEQAVASVTPSLTPPAAATVSLSQAATATSPSLLVEGTPTLIVTPTPPAATSTSTPVSELADAVYFTSGYLDGWNFFFAIETSQPVTGSYYAIVDGNKDYTCEVQMRYPNRLYCHGRLPKMEDWVDYEVYEAGTARLVSEGNFFIPMNLPR